MFLQSSSQLIATEIRDYSEWHRGRSDYGLWYIEITQPEIIEYLDEIQHQFSDILIQSNLRQYHITLFVCGFLTEYSPCWDDDFELSLLIKQIKLLDSLKLEEFELEITHIDSFSSALFLQVNDPENHLGNIRQQLAQHSHEIAAPHYCPHITLGLYQRALQGQALLERLQNINFQKFKIQVKQLTFGYYNAHSLQGCLYPYQQIQLGSLCCNSF